MQALFVDFLIVLVFSNACQGRSNPNGKNFGEESFRCGDSNDDDDSDKTRIETFSDGYRSKAAQTLPGRPFDVNQKRSVLLPVTKRQVGVIYRDDRPIGILQPFQRSYRFIPVKEDQSVEPNPLQDLVYQGVNLEKKKKREVPGKSKNYPSILAKFRIRTKLDKKSDYSSSETVLKRNSLSKLLTGSDGPADNNLQNLKRTIRNEDGGHIEDRLKNILDDMGLIDDDDSSHAKKRETNKKEAKEESDEGALIGEDDDKIDRSKRDSSYTTVKNLWSTELASKEDLFSIENNQKNLDKNSIHKRHVLDPSDSEDVADKERNKREQSDKEDLDTIKEPADINVREAVNKAQKKAQEEENDKRVEREIQAKINSLKDEVKRELAALKKSHEDAQRRKRQTSDSLDEKSDALNPVLHPDEELKPLIRKRRQIEADQEEKCPGGGGGGGGGSNIDNDRNKRDDQESQGNSFDELDQFGTMDKRQISQEISNNKISNDNELIDEEGLKIKTPVSSLKRQPGVINDRQSHESENEDYDRIKRFNDDTYEDFNNYYDDGDRSKRENFDDYYMHEVKQPVVEEERPRYRRRIVEDQDNLNRPRQLSDMSDLDLFGALPKSYDGELSRYKRVKRLEKQ